MSHTDAMAAETAERAGAVAGEQVTGSEAEHSRLALGARRIRAYAERADRERQAAMTLHPTKGASTQPHRSPRVAEIDRMRAAYGAPPTSTTASAHELREVNASVRAIRDSLINNPLWLEATAIEAAPAPAAVTHLQNILETMEPELAAARDAVAICAGKVVEAEEVLRDCQARPAWVRAAQNWLLQAEERAHAALSSARAEVAAAQGALDAMHGRAESQARAARAVEELADQERRGPARLQRELLEIPLREALLELAMIDAALRGRDMQPLRAASPEQRLKMVSLHSEPGFAVVVLEAATTTYVADWTGLEEQERASVARSIAGDVFRYERGEGGSRSLKLVELASLTPEHAVLEGHVGATHHRNQQIVEFQLIDASGGRALGKAEPR